MKKVCRKCGQEKDISEFYKNKGTKDGYLSACKPCSDNRHPKICEICGKEFLGKNKKQKFCSIECRGINDREPIECNCDYCGKLFITNRYKFESSKLHYCSSECMGKDRKGENNPAWKDRIEYNCDYCGEKIKLTKKDYNRATKHYCSPECQGKHQSIINVGENNPCWNPNLTDEEREKKRQYKEYDEWRNDVFKRDNYTCIITGESKSGCLVAHHLYSYSTYKDLRTDVNNGVTILKDIHIEFHSIYGYFNNTAEEFYEFYKMKTGKEFKLGEAS